MSTNRADLELLCYLAERTVAVVERAVDLHAHTGLSSCRSAENGRSYSPRSANN